MDQTKDVSQERSVEMLVSCEEMNTKIHSLSLEEMPVELGFPIPNLIPLWM